MTALAPITPEHIAHLKRQREVARKMIAEAVTPDEIEWAAVQFDGLDVQIKEAEQHETSIAH